MSVRSLAVSLVIALCAFFGLSTTASAAPSDLDKTFGNGGIALPNFGGVFSPFSSTVQPDGKILVAGAAFGTNAVRNNSQLLARFNQNGTFDSTFGNGGIVLTDYSAIPLNTEYGLGVTLMADGRIVMTGVVGGDEEAPNDDAWNSTISRFLANGAPDPSFGPGLNGKKELSIGDSGKKDYAFKAVAGDNNELFVVGTAFRSTDDDGYALKLLSNGEPDDDFGTNGIRYVVFTEGEADDTGVDLVRLSGGTLAVLAKCDTADDDDCAAIRGFDELTGSTESGFAIGGTYKFDIGEYPNLIGMIKQANGRIVVAYNPEGTGSLKTRGLLPDATGVDPSYGIAGDGEITLPGHSLVLESIAKTEDGGILASGRAGNEAAGGAFVRVTPGGSGLSTFGTNGAALIPGTSGQTFTAAAVQPDGRYVGVGIGGAGTSHSIVRLIGDGPEPVPPAVPVALSTKIKSPSKSKMKASKLKSISGTATGTGLVKVKLAIQRIDPKLLKKSKRCLFVTGAKGKTKKIKPVKKKCAPTKYLTAKGTTNWSYKIKLKPGKYKLFLVGVGDGAQTSKTTTKTFTLTK